MFPKLVLGPGVKEETLPGRREQVPPPQPTPQWGGMLRGHRPRGTGGQGDLSLPVAFLEGRGSWVPSVLGEPGRHHPSGPGCRLSQSDVLL